MKELTNQGHLARLRQAIEDKAGRPMLTPKDFDFLVDRIFEELHQTVSPSTLKRLWGYVTEVGTPRVSTLNILAQYVGFADWTGFCLSGEEEQEPASGGRQWAVGLNYPPRKDSFRR